ITRKNKYASAVIAFAPGDEPTREQEQEVLDQFLEVAGAGLKDPSGLTYVAVRHVASPPHIHVVMLLEDATTGKFYNPAPPRWEKHFGPIVDVYNAKYGWAHPGDPARARAFAGTRGRRSNDEVRSRIEDDILARAQRGELPDRDALRAACEQHGEVTRMGKGYVSIKVEGEARAMRFKTSIFAADNPNEAAAAADQPAPPPTPNIGNEIEAQMRLNQVIADRQQWWKKKEQESDERTDSRADQRDRVAAGTAAEEPARPVGATAAADSGPVRTTGRPPRTARKLSQQVDATVGRTIADLEATQRSGFWARARRAVTGHDRQARRHSPLGQRSWNLVEAARRAVRSLATWVRPELLSVPAEQPAAKANEPMRQGLFGDAEAATPPGTGPGKGPKR
ncbi:MAG: hypothetical protein K0U28_07990, partial [Cyanobacteria bacterium]|nr:hypothetical protein [Cyanobacteriota bacterium]